MAYEIPGFVLGTLLAGDDLSAAQYRFVEITDGDSVGLAAALSAKVVGSLNNAPTEGGVCEIVTSGVAKVVCDDTVAEGAIIEVGASGGADTLSTGYGVGIALEDGIVNQVISVRLGEYGATEIVV